MQATGPVSASADVVQPPPAPVWTYASQSQADALAREKRAAADYIAETAEERHQIAQDTSAEVTIAINATVLLVVLVSTFFFSHIYSLRFLNPKVFKWWDENFPKGPRPLGTAYFNMWCAAISAEYPAFYKDVAWVRCPTVPQSSAIFVMLMIQHFGKHMQGVHYSGNSEQLNHRRFKTYISSWKNWQRSDNPWRFLYPTESAWGLAPAVVKAKTSQGTILEHLYMGGLCDVAISFVSPDVDADDLCVALLTAKLVYWQPCGAAKFMKAAQIGGLAGATVASAAQVVRTVHAVKTGKTVANATNAIKDAKTAMNAVKAGKDAEEAVNAARAARRGIRIAKTVNTVKNVAETANAAKNAGVAAETAATAVSSSADTAGGAACAAIGIATLGFGFVACMLVVEAIVAIIVTLILNAVVAGITTAMLNALMACPTGQYYTVEKNKDGEYVRAEWIGDPSVLPPRNKEATKD